MGLYARRALQAVALILTGVSIYFAATGVGSDRAFHVVLCAAVVAGLSAIGVELSRGDKVVMAATRLLAEVMQERREEGE